MEDSTEKALDMLASLKLALLRANKAIIVPTKTEALMNLISGDHVMRMLGNDEFMEMIVTHVSKGKIYCQPKEIAIPGMTMEDYCFLQSTGGEIDKYLGWDGEVITGSWIKPIS